MSTGDQAPRVVVGIDGSQSSYAALRWAVRHAGLIGGTVDAVAAYELPGAHGWSAPAVDAEFDAAEAKRGLVEEVRKVLGEKGEAQVHERLVHGNPTEALLAAAEGAELLVVGSRGRGVRPDAARLGEPAGRPARALPGRHRPAGRRRAGHRDRRPVTPQRCDGVLR